MALQIAILGSVEPRVNGDVVGVPAGKQRALLTLLAVRAPHAVSAESAAEALWPRAAPAEAMRSLQVTVSRLRRSLGPAGSALETAAPGYRLAVEADAIDARRFETLIGAARAVRVAGDAAAARRLLDDALGLWRGPALADVGFESFAQTEIARLEELRVAALEERIDARLAGGEHRLVVAELEQLSAVHPSRERLVGLLMLALYRCGRQTDALDVYTRGRLRLHEELGLEPSPVLQRLQEAILRHDPSLEALGGGDRDPSHGFGLEPAPELRALERAVLPHDPVVDLAPRARGVVGADEPATAAHIPAPPTPTIGREAELAALYDLLGEPAARMVTVVGPGGVGKTRLVLELARSTAERFADGVYFVTLAPVSAHANVASTIARELDVVMLPSESAEHGLARHLRNRDVLLVLDNFEHVLDAAPLVADLIAATTSMKVLVTSREPLRLRAERLFQLDPLALPPVAPDGDEVGVEQAPAVALFVAVAHARDANFTLSVEIAPAVARVCRRLDGLPLAIELAAARIGLLTVPELAARLGEGLDALGSAPRDAPARQRTLTSTLEWSYGLLTRDEQSALASLSAFAGGCSVDAAQAVTGASLDVLEALVAKNLVVRRSVVNGRSRLALLETVGDFARDRLAERRDRTDAFQRHFAYYLALAERSALELERSESPALMAELDREVHNLRSALVWTLDRRRALPALRLATALQEYWERRDPREGTRWLRAALALPDDDVPASVRAAALGALGFCLIEPDTLDDAQAAARESLELARSIGAAAQCAASTTVLAVAALEADRCEDGYRHATEAESLACEARDEPKRVIALHIKALVAPTLGEALALGEQAARAYRRAGSHRRLAMLQSSLAYSALIHGDHAAAGRLTTEALQSAETLGDPFVLSFAAGNEGLVRLLAGDVAHASEAFIRELQLANQHTDERMVYEAINGLAGVAAARGEDELAARLTGAAETASLARHPPAIAQQLEDRCFAPARGRLGERAWQAARAAGAALTPRQAAQAALNPRSVVPSDSV